MATTIQVESVVISEEIKFVKALCSNNKNERNVQLKKLLKWLRQMSIVNTHIVEEHFRRIWKGLFFNMWLADKPILQEELAENLGKLICCLEKTHSIQFFCAFLLTMSEEWFGIDQWRIDKFLMLLRRVLRSTFIVFKKQDWSEKSIVCFNKLTLKFLLNENSSSGLVMHYLDIFLEELAKVSKGDLFVSTVNLFITPFIKFMGKRREIFLLEHCRKSVFYNLLYQSDLGRAYVEKYTAWKNMGFPTESIDHLEEMEMEPVENDYSGENGSYQSSLDPRAGGIDVIIPVLPVDSRFIVDEIDNLACDNLQSKKNRKFLMGLRKLFLTFQSGIFPLGVKNIPKPNLRNKTPLIKEKIDQLEDMEGNMYSTTRNLKKLNKRSRKKLLNRLTSANADQSNYEEIIQDLISQQCLNRKTEEKAKCVSKTAVKTLYNTQKFNIPNIDRTHLKFKFFKQTNRKKNFTKSIKKNENMFVLSASQKRVKIALKKNTFQNPNEYIKQVKNSPTIPYDADKKPVKGLLKQNERTSSTKLSLNFNSK